MEANEKTLTLFTTRIRQLILQFKDLKKENADLYAMVDERDARISELEAKLAQAQNDYNSLKMARMIEISDGDLEGAQKRLAKLIKDVNKCITLLSEK
jgi:predicted RNase H-like nuclease (RuvC/YqgF family)